MTFKSALDLSLLYEMIPNLAMSTEVRSIYWYKIIFKMKWFFLQKILENFVLRLEKANQEKSKANTQLLITTVYRASGR